MMTYQNAMQLLNCNADLSRLTDTELVGASGAIVRTFWNFAEDGDYQKIRAELDRRIELEAINERAN